jgi:hypothetical protein
VVQVADVDPSSEAEASLEWKSHDDEQRHGSGSSLLQRKTCRVPHQIDLVTSTSGVVV